LLGAAFDAVVSLATTYARIADERGIAGHACEQSYLKLTAP
jgi:hypothetical protein